MTFDIYTNRVPFGLLTAGEQSALQDCGGPWKIFDHDGWREIENPAWFSCATYRAVRPAKPADMYVSDAPADDRDLTIRAALAALTGLLACDQFGDMDEVFAIASTFVAEARKRGLA